MALIPRPERITNPTNPVLRLLPWVCLLLITFVEVVVLTDARLGLILHAVLLLGFITYRTYLATSMAGRNLCLALCLLPIMRMLSLGLPYAALPKDSWHFLVSVPMLIAVIFALRHMGWRDPDSPADANDHTHAIRVQRASLPSLVLIGCGGVALGQIVFSGMKLLALKELIVTNLDNTGWMTLLPVVSGLALSALCEEIIFRSMIQSSAGLVMGARVSVAFTALLYTVMCLGNMTLTSLPLEFALVFIIALLFSVVVHWSGSIVGNSLAHIALNVTTFVVLPALPANLSIAIPVMVTLSAALGAAGLMQLALRQNR
jgi:hypothetical protein